MSFIDLPFLHQIFDEEAEEQVEPKPAKIDPRLENWEKWLQERDHVNAYLGEKLNRHPCDLIMNYGESLRSIKIDKELFEYSRIAYPYDRYRGNPSFFKTPAALRKKCPNDPNYFKVMSKQEMNQVPEVEYVEIPRLTQSEKHADCPGYRNAKGLWLSSSYRQLRMKQLKDKLKVLEPFRPCLEEMSIRGRSINLLSPQTWQPHHLRAARRTRDDFDVIYSPREIDIHANEEYLSFNGIKICPHCETDVNVFVEYDYDINSSAPQSRSIELVNGTSLAIKFDLFRIPRQHLFKDIANENDEQVFFFDKRQSILLPHETKNIEVWFKTDVSCSYTCTLLFIITPAIFTKKVFLNLTAVATKTDLEDKIAHVKKYIDEKVKRNAVSQTLEDILNVIPPQEAERVTLYTYDRSYIFEAINQKWSAKRRRPKYIYDKEVVDELERFYVRVRFSGCPQIWNYNVETLRQITRKRERLNRQKNLLDQIYMIKLKDLKKRKDAGEDIDKELEAIKCKTKNRKYSEEIKSDVKESTKGVGEEDKTDVKEDVEGVKETIEALPFSEKLDSVIEQIQQQITQSVVEEIPLTVELENIIQRLDEPSFCINDMCDIHQYVYAILCITIDNTVFDVEKMKKILRLSKTQTSPTELHSVLPDPIRVEQVFLDEEHPKQPKIDQNFTQLGAPPAECLQNIPAADFEARHRAYFGIQEVETDGKGKKGKKGKSKKEKNIKETKGKKDKKNKKGQKDAVKSISERPPTPQVDLKEDHDFCANPLVQSEIDSEISLAQNSSTQSDVNQEMPSRAQLEQYEMNLYKIFYKHISRAVLRISDVIENSRRRKMLLPEFRNVYQENIGTSKAVDVKYIDLKKAFRRALGIKYSPKVPSRKKIETLTKRDKLLKPSMKTGEHLKPKQQDSQWSILQPLKKPEPSQKPISYPELCLLVRKKNVKKECVDVGTVMSTCGIDPDWQDFKAVGVQAELEPYKVGEWEKRGVAAGILEDLVTNVCVKEYEMDAPDEELSVITYSDLDEEEEDEVVFYDESNSELEMNNEELCNVNLD